ncbi:MAG: hypothetical protein P8100_07540 [bacterium]|jgi:hypothetical protein
MPDFTEYIIDRLEQEAATLPEQKNRCLQHLIELGYIPLFKVNALTPKDITGAKADFLREATASGLYSETELRKEIFETEDEFLAELLGKATDIDEGFTFKNLPATGETNLVTRIIHYRLDIFGMWPFPVNTPFNVINSIAALKTIAGYADTDELKTVNYLADIEFFTKRLLEIHPDEDFILTFKTRKVLEKDLVRSLNRSVKFKRQLIRDFGERSDFFKYLNKEVLKENVRKVDFAFMDKEAANPFKRFILRLIQVHQWQDGLYDGLLDSDIGEVTITSILNSIDLFNSAGNKNVESFQVLTHVVSGYFLFNGLFFLQEYMVEDGSETSGNEDVIVNDVLNSVERADDEKLNLFELRMDLLKTEIAATSKSEPEEKKGFLKRIYFGVKKFFQKVISISKKIFGWIVKLAKKFWGLLKKVFGHFFAKLAKGIKAFVDGIKFLLGKKGTTTTHEKGMIASVIRMDGDCYNFVAGDVSLIIQQHNHKIKYNTTSMEFALSVVGGVLNIVMKAFSVLSWPMLIFSIIKVFKHISESYKKLELITIN